MLPLCCRVPGHRALINSRGGMLHLPSQKFTFPWIMVRVSGGRSVTVDGAPIRGSRPGFSGDVAKHSLTGDRTVLMGERRQLRDSSCAASPQG